MAYFFTFSAENFYYCAANLLAVGNCIPLRLRLVGPAEEESSRLGILRTVSFCIFSKYRFSISFKYFASQQV